MRGIHICVVLLLLGVGTIVQAGEFPDSWTWDKDAKARDRHAALEGKPMPPLDLTGAFAGYLPTPRSFQKLYRFPWTEGQTVNLAIGLFHPPFGINIFVAQSVLGLKLETIYRGIIPFVIIYLVALALITYIPDLSLIGVRYLLARG